MFFDTDLTYMENLEKLTGNLPLYTIGFLLFLLIFHIIEWRRKEKREEMIRLISMGYVVLAMLLVVNVISIPAMAYLRSK